MGGGPASGKSSLPADESGAAVINPDDIKAQLPEYQAMTAAGDPGAAAYVHEESSQIAGEARAAAEGAGIDYVNDGTGDSSYDKMAGKVQAAEDAGYTANARYVTVDTQTAIDRAESRAANPASSSYGRMVPAPVIREIHSSVSDVFGKAVGSGLFNGKVELYDNNGSSPRLIASGSGGSLTVHDQAAYDSFLAKGKGGGG
jgi:predicted ABC-type ATPase